MASGAVAARSRPARRRWPALAGTVCLTLVLALVLAGGLIGLPEEAALQALWPGVGAAVGLAMRSSRPQVAAVAGGLLLATLVVLAAAGWTVPELLATSILLGAVAVGIVALLRGLGAGPLRRPRDLALFTVTVGAVGVFSCGPAILLDRATGGMHPGFLPVSWLVGLLWGVFAITPFVWTARWPRCPWPAGRIIELGAAAGLTFLAACYAFWIVAPGEPGIFGWPYLVIVGLMLVAIRFGVRIVAALLALVAWFAAAQSATGHGTFVAGGESPTDWLLVTEMFTVVITGAVLLVAVLTDERSRAFAEQQRRTHYVRQVLDASQSQIYAKSYEEGDGRYILTNRGWAQAAGLASESGEGATDSELFGEGVGRIRQREDQAVVAANEARTAEENILQAGEPRVVLSTKFPLRDSDGRPWGVGGIATDITTLARAQKRERRQSDRLEAVFTVSPTPAMRVVSDPAAGLQVLDSNHAMQALTSRISGSPDGNVLALVAPEDHDTVTAAVQQACEPGGEGFDGPRPQQEIRLRADGRERWVLFSAAAVGLEKSGRQELVLQFTDITDRKQAERALNELALTDSVTGLPNRYALLDRLRAALDRLRRHPSVVCVLFCDLDQFKHVNDTLGHQVGDSLLVDVAGRIRAATRPEDTVARLGGDEFVVVYEGLADPMAAVLLAMRLQESIRLPWEHGDQVFRPTMSVGVASTTSARTSIDDLLRRADLAMYRAKEGGRDRVQLYDQSLGRALKHTVGIQQRLRAAVDRDDLILHYQPIVDLRRGGVIGSEALLRMRGARGRVIPPGEFIPQAETSGLIGPVGAWVVQQALQDLRDRHDRGRRPQSVSINVSPAQLHRPGFSELLLEQVARNGLDPACIVVEVTETALVHDRAHVTDILNQLHAAGVSIALDDFGTGYSSLSWLTQFPVDLVKIDRSFTAQLGTDTRGTAVVSAVIAVAEELELTVVAEGVETPEQRERLVDLSCPLAQGYLLGRPVPADDPMWV